MMQIKHFHDNESVRHDPVRKRVDIGYAGDGVYCICCQRESWVSDEEFEFLWERNHILDDHVWIPTYMGKGNAVEYIGGQVRIIDVTAFCPNCHSERFGEALSHDRLDSEQMRRLERDRLIKKIQLICKQIDQLDVNFSH